MDFGISIFCLQTIYYAFWCFAKLHTNLGSEFLKLSYQRHRNVYLTYHIHTLDSFKWTTSKSKLLIWFTQGYESNAPLQDFLKMMKPFWTSSNPVRLFYTLTRKINIKIPPLDMVCNNKLEYLHNHFVQFYYYSYSSMPFVMSNQLNLFKLFVCFYWTSLKYIFMKL